MVNPFNDHERSAKLLIFTVFSTHKSQTDLTVRLGLLLTIVAVFGCQRSEDLPQLSPVPFEPISGEFNVLLDGDSRTDGWNCKNQTPYMDWLTFGDSIRFSKVSYGGATMWQLNHRTADVYQLRYDPLRKNLIVLWVGVNDMIVHNVRAGALFDQLKTYCYSRKAEGWDVILCTEVSMKGKNGDQIFDEERMLLNDTIRQTWMDYADGLADLGRSSVLGSQGAYADTKYFCDSIHLTPQGTYEVAKIIQRAIKIYLGIPLRRIAERDEEDLLLDSQSVWRK